MELLNAARHGLRAATAGKSIRPANWPPQRGGVAPALIPEDALDVAFDVLRQPQLEQVGVIGVRRTPRFVRVVRHDRAFLLAVQRFDRGVDVEYPGGVEQGGGAVLEVPVEARLRLRLPGWLPVPA